MTDRETLHARILGDPADDTPRAVLADILQESEAAADRRLGRWVWAGVTASRFRAHPNPLEDPAYRDALAAIEEADPAFFRGLLEDSHLLSLYDAADTGARILSDNTHDRVTVTFRMGSGIGSSPGRVLRAWPPRQAVFERGMLTGLRVPFGLWRLAAAAVLTNWPLEWVEVTDVPGLTLRVAGGEFWQVSGRLNLPGGSRRVGRLGTVRESATALELDSRRSFNRASFVHDAAVLSDDVRQRLRDLAGPERWPAWQGGEDLSDPRPANGGG